MKLKVIYLFFFIFSSFIFSQKTEYSVSSISPDLKLNANAVIRLNDLNIIIKSQKDMVLKSKKVITILNELGLKNLDIYENYDKSRKISKIEAKIINAFGDEIKSYKRKDFKDICLSDGFSVFTDNRALYLDYTPTEYPFTIVFTTEINTSNTAFIPSWSPSEGYFISTEKSKLEVSYPKQLGFKYKEDNFSLKFNINKIETDNNIIFETQDIKAKKGEDNSPEFISTIPTVYLKIEKFNLEGIDGEANSWKDFGKWYYDNLLIGTTELSFETQNKIKQLVGDEKNPIQIAKIIYKFVQDKTRYVSIQVGIGGFKPMSALDVDRLGYGDCKALSNYMRSLLSVVNIPSYYTIVYANPNFKRNIQEDFVSVQGNHVILAIPNQNEIIWLECTNQTIPFGYQGSFTDDRNVLMIRPEGGEIVKTKSFLEKENSQTTQGNYSISSDGKLIANMSIISKGSQYYDIFENQSFTQTEKENYYKSYFNNINNLKLDKMDFKNNKNEINFTQNISLSANNYAPISADKMMFVLNVFNLNSSTPKKYRNRENDFEINRGYYDYDEATVDLPLDFEIEYLPSTVNLKTKFGEYQTEIKINNPNNITYKRTLFLKNGFYENTEYEDYRIFREQIAKNDNSKIILKKKFIK